MDNNSNSRLRPYPETNSVKVTFQKGEKVEAVWSTDGQRYPGTIVQVYPNDNYEILFNDGVKTRRKSNHIFKLGKRRQVRPLPNKNLHPSSPAANVPVVTATVTSTTTMTNIKPLPALIPVKTSLGHQIIAEKGAATPPLPLLSNHHSSSSNCNSTGSDSPSSSASASPHPHFQNSLAANEDTTLPTSNTISSTTKAATHLPSARTLTTTVEVSDHSVSGPSSVTTPSLKSELNTNLQSTKRGFVYVQQPHYSVFDPPPTDLGKRRRRVHNYSMLAKGPPLKGGLLSAGVNDDGTIDGETSRSVSPVTAVAENTPKHQNSSTTVPTTTRRRFLTCPAKSSNSKIFTSSRTTSARTEENIIVSSSGRKTVRNSNSSSANAPSSQIVPKSSRISISDSNSSTDKKDMGEAGKLVLLSKDEFKSKVNSSAGNKDKSTDTSLKKIESQVTPTPIAADVASVEQEQKLQNDSDVIPTKRLRKPNIKRFSAEEGYVDIFSWKKSNRPKAMSQKTTSSRGRALQPNIPAEASDITPKLQVQRPRSKSYTHHATRKTRQLGPPVLMPEIGQKSYSTSNSVSVELDSEVNLKLSTKPKANNCDYIDKSESESKLNQEHKPHNHNNVEERELAYQVVSEEEELLDIGEYTVCTSAMPQIKESKNHLTSHLKEHHVGNEKKPRSPTSKDVVSKTVKLHSPITKATVSDISIPPPAPEETIPVNTTPSEGLQKEVSPVLVESSTLSVGIRNSRRRKGRGRGRGRRWTVNKKIPNENEKLPAEHEHSHPMPSVVLNRIPEVQIVVQKCDSVISSSVSTFSSIVEKPVEMAHKANSDVPSTAEPITSKIAALNSEITSTTSAGASFDGSWKQQRRKRWGEGKNRWSKPRQKTGGLLRAGMRVHDSLKMQLIKRSKIQRRYEKRGRPKEALLTGLTKKKLKKIQESVKRRKLHKKKMQVETKFKDVRVDIINCICGRTDEFGMMVQCEVCLCWQHGICFNIYDRDRLPKFYVCQSCNSPKAVRPSKLMEGIRMETYKKGVLPSYPFTPKPSERRQRIIKNCNELSKVMQSINDSIRQNTIKERIAISEPEHPKLYQWSIPRIGPKDQIQKWQFNKYFKAVLRRLMNRHKCKPAYMEKLKNTVSFREKLKKYTQAFEEARSAISRKLGTRALILIEKLSEHNRKMEKINKLKQELYPDPKNEGPSLAPETPKSTNGEQSSENVSLPPPPPPLQGREAEDKVTIDNNTIGSDKKFQETVFDEIFEVHADMRDEYSDSDSDESDDSDTTDSDDSADEYETELEVGDVPVPMVEDWTAVMEIKLGRRNRKQSSMEVSSKNIGCNLEALSDSTNEKNNHKKTVSPEEIIAKLEESVKNKKPRVLEEPVEFHRRSGDFEADLIKVLNCESRTDSADPGDIESEGTLSGDTTVSVEDSEGGEEFWYNSITSLNSEYNEYRGFLLNDPLAEDDTKNDLDWQPTEEDLPNKDWKWDLISEIGLDEKRARPRRLKKWEKADSDLEEDTTLIYTSSDVDDEDSENEPEKDSMSDKKRRKLQYWKKAILELENNDDTDESDTDWQIEGAVEIVSSSESDSDSENDIEQEEISNTTPSSSTAPATGTSSNTNKVTLPSPGMEETKKPNSTSRSGLMITTTDPDAKPGDIVEVVLGEEDEIFATGVVVAGSKGQNFIKLIDTTSETHHDDTNQPEQSSSKNILDQDNNDSLQNSIPLSQNIPLCKSCRDSLGTKWNLNQLSSAKGVDIFIENTMQMYVDELKRYCKLGVKCATTNIDVQLFPKMPQRSYASHSRHEQYLNYSRIANNSLQQLNNSLPQHISSLSNPELRSILNDDRSNEDIPLGVSRPLPPTSAEEESILSLLSLSKTTGQFNGENISELSIESLRKLTDRLQHNGPLSEDLAKAVGQPLVNGKVFQNCHSLQNVMPTLGTPLPEEVPPLCVRCSLKGKSSKTLSICCTANAEFAGETSAEEMRNFRTKANEAITQVQAAVHAIKRTAFQHVKNMMERYTAEKLALAAGQKITPEIVQRRLAVKRAERYLQGLRSEYVDALIPYSTYFISKFTKKDEMSQAKQNWVIDMIQNYNKAKKSLKEMYETETNETRIAKEDKFYTALDNLRKSFDIVLTKKDIKMRRQDQNSSSGTDATTSNNQNQRGINSNKIEDNIKKIIENPTSSSATVPFTLVNGDIAENLLQASSVTGDFSSSNAIVTSMDMDSNNSNICNQNAESEMDIVNRLSTYPIKDEDVDALLGIALAQSKELIKSDFLSESNMLTPLTNGIQGEKALMSDTSSSETKQEDLTHLDSQTQQLQLQNGTVADEEPMEMDELIFAENLDKATDSMLIGGDMDLLNTIGTLGTAGDLKGTEDSDLLLNVFEDPVFSEPQEEPKPCCSKSLVNSTPLPIQPKYTGPVLQRLTPEMCRGYLIEDIRAHQQIIDGQLDRLEAELMELERKRGRGLQENDDKTDSKLSDMLINKMQTLFYNMDVLNSIAEYQIGENNPEEEETNDQEESEQRQSENDDEDEDEQEELSEEEVDEESEPEVEIGGTDVEDNSDAGEKVDQEFSSESDIEDFFEENM